MSAVYLIETLTAIWLDAVFIFLIWKETFFTYEHKQMERLFLSLDDKNEKII